MPLNKHMFFQSQHRHHRELYFLQKGNVMFVKIGDYILKEGTDFVIFNYNKIRINSSLMTNSDDIITYEFYYDKDTVNEDFTVA